MKKVSIFICLVTLFFIIVQILVGCSSNTINDVSDNNLELTLDKEVTIKFLFPGIQHSDVERILNELEKKTYDYLKAKIIMQFIPYDQYEKEIKSLIASGDTFDAMESRSYNYIQNWAEEGLLLDITELFKRYAAEYYKKFSKEQILEASYNGRIVAVPNFWPNITRMCAIVNKELIEKYNISAINDFDEYENFLETIKENERDIVPATGKWSVEHFNEAYGYINVIRELPTLVYQWNEPGVKIIPWEQADEFKNVYEMLKRWFKKGYVDNSVIGEWKEYATPVFTGEAASTLVDFKYAYTMTHLGYVEVPLEIFPLFMDRLSVKGSSVEKTIVFNKNAANSERALMFIEWIHSKQEIYDLFMYGIEEEHYTLSDGKLVLPNQKDPYYRWYEREVFLDINLNRPLENEPQQFNELLINLAEKSKHSISAGFVPEISEDDPIIQTFIKRIENFNRMNQDIAQGIFDTDIDEFIKEQKKEGVDDLVELLQIQLNKWLREKK